MKLTYRQAASIIQQYNDWRNGKSMYPKRTDEALELAIDTLSMLAEEKHPETEEAKILEAIKEKINNIYTILDQWN